MDGSSSKYHRTIQDTRQYNLEGSGSGLTASGKSSIKTTRRQFLHLDISKRLSYWRQYSLIIGGPIRLRNQNLFYEKFLRRRSLCREDFRRCFDFSRRGRSP